MRAEAGDGAADNSLPQFPSIYHPVLHASVRLLIVIDAGPLLRGAVRAAAAPGVCCRQTAHANRDTLQPCLPGNGLDQCDPSSDVASVSRSAI
jgi:hypothetical protein